HHRVPDILRTTSFPALVGLGMILASAFLLSGKSAFPGVAATLPVIGAALVIIGQARLLAWRPLVGLGLISYPLYLWHWPLLTFAGLTDRASMVERVGVVFLSIVLAW